MSPNIIDSRKLNTDEKQRLTMCTENKAQKSELLQWLAERWDCWFLHTLMDPRATASSVC